MLTTKVERYRALADQTALMNALHTADARVNLSWGSNTIIQVAAGYADVAVEFAKGFAPYDILPGLYIGLKTGLTIVDLSGNPITSKLDLGEHHGHVPAQSPASQTLALHRRQGTGAGGTGA